MHTGLSHRDVVKTLQKTLTAFAIIIIFFGFTEAVNPPTGNWYQQFMPNIGSRQIQDVFFLDSLTGWAVTPYVTQNDSAFVLKSTNAGDNWFFANIRTGQFVGFNKIKFINSLTGFVCGVSQSTGYKGLSKSTDGGFTWVSLNVPNTSIYSKDMSILNQDTIWLVDDDNLTGGVFYTSNGGTSWVQQPAPPSDHIYMCNSRIGFVCKSTAASPNIYKTTNGGLNWNINLPNENFTDMHFIDSLTGWKCSSSQPGLIKKTTSGGTSWIIQNLPPEAPPLTFSRMSQFSFVNQDTIWGIGGVYAFPNGQDRAIIYKTTNGGNNWNYQIPDTSINIFVYWTIQFIDSKKGWAYSPLQGGVHTISGGDSITAIHQISNNIPKEFKLYQNYPNPFNPNTKIKYQVAPPLNLPLSGGDVNALAGTVGVKLTIFDIMGREVIILVNQKQNAGIYEVDFSGDNYSSGIYFYSLFADNNLIETKKMILLK